MGETARYLAYGSNLHPLRLRERGIGVELVEAVPLRGWQLDFNKIGQDGSAKCSITRSRQRDVVVWCALYHIRRDSIARLDAIEGLGHGYEKTSVRLHRHGPAYTYLASPTATSETLKPFSWYREIVVAGALFHSFPTRYVASLRATDASEDPDPRRGSEHAELLRRLTRS